MMMYQRNSLYILTIITILFNYLFNYSFIKTVSAEHFYIVDKKGNISSTVDAICKLTGININPTLTGLDKLKYVVTQTQAAWIRKTGTERYDMQIAEIENQEALKEQFAALNFYQEIKPHKKHFKYLLLLGALFNTMQKRLEYAVNLYESGIKFDNIVLLAGARPAAAHQGENEQVFLTLSKESTLENPIKTETDMLKLLYKHTLMPAEMRKIPIQIIDTPMQKNQDGSLRRPNTADTIAYWLDTNPEPGSCLAISNQPYIVYQKTVLKSYIPELFDVQVVGPDDSKNDSINLLLDTLARILYQELQYLQKHR